MAYTEIKSYTIYQYSGASGTGLIFLYDKTNRHIGNAYFIHEDNLPLPWQDANGFVSLYMHDTSYLPVVDMLRNEKPCYLWWFNTSGAISTSNEPVGENEFRIRP